LWARKRWSVPSSMQSATTPRQAPSSSMIRSMAKYSMKNSAEWRSDCHRACAAWRGRCGRRRRRCAAPAGPRRTRSSCRRRGAGRSCRPRCARTARRSARVRRRLPAHSRQRYSIASWSPSQSDPLTVSYMCQRQSSGPMLPSAAAMPPCAATVCERVGNTLVMHAVLRPASRSRASRASPRRRRRRPRRRRCDR
jgi:hypothetical protein